MKLSNREDCDKILSLFFDNPEVGNRDDIKIFKNKKKISKKDYESEISKIINNKSLEHIEKQKNLLNNQITLENVSDSLDYDKIYEIFFIYGDIIEIVLNKFEVR